MSTRLPFGSFANDAASFFGYRVYSYFAAPQRSRILV